MPQDRETSRPSAFPTTQWSVVLDVAAKEPERAAGQVRPPLWENNLHIQAGAGTGSNRTGASMDSPARIAMLQSQIKGLLKKIQALRKALMEATDPAQRMELMKQINDLQDQVRMAQAQIAELQMRAKRREQAEIREPKREDERGR